MIARPICIATSAPAALESPALAMSPSVFGGYMPKATENPCLNPSNIVVIVVIGFLKHPSRSQKKVSLLSQLCIILLFNGHNDECYATTPWDLGITYGTRATTVSKSRGCKIFGGNGYSLEAVDNFASKTMVPLLVCSFSARIWIGIIVKEEEEEEEEEEEGEEEVKA